MVMRQLHLWSLASTQMWELSPECLNLQFQFVVFPGDAVLCCTTTGKWDLNRIVSKIRCADQSLDF
jgi:hypothetical protein